VIKAELVGMEADFKREEVRAGTFAISITLVWVIAAIRWYAAKQASQSALDMRRAYNYKVQKQRRLFLSSSCFQSAPANFTTTTSLLVMSQPMILADMGNRRGERATLSLRSLNVSRK
jgi:hypothetical protein